MAEPHTWPSSSNFVMLRSAPAFLIQCTDLANLTASRRYRSNFPSEVSVELLQQFTVLGAEALSCKASGKALIRILRELARPFLVG